MVTPVKSNQQHIFIHDALVEGPIEGLLYGDASIFLNGNRVKDLDPDAPWTPVNGKITFSSGSNTGTVAENIPASMGGIPKNDNFVVLRNDGILRAGAKVEGTAGNITITGGSAFNSLYNTYNESDASDLIEDRFVALADPDTNAIIAIGEGRWTSGSTLKFSPSNINYGQYYWLTSPSVSYNVQVIEIIKITSISASNNTITLENAPSAGNGTYTFSLTGSRFPSADDLDAENPGSSNNFVAQFRDGSTFQDPITELNGVGGGTSYTVNLGDLSNTTLRQIDFSTWNTNNPNDTLTGAQVHPTGDYPEGQSITTEGNTEPFIVEGSDFSSNPDVIKSLDEVRISIGYSSLQAIRKDNGDDIFNHAKYLIQIARKAPGASGFEKYKHAFKSADGVSVGQIQHAGKDRSPVSFEHYIDLSIIKPFEDFKIRIFRLTRPKGRAVESGGGNAPPDWDTDQGDSTSSVSNVVGINNDKFSYPYTSHIGLFLDSREYTSIPKRSYEIRGMKVKVPQGYLPREYSSATQSKTDAISGTSANYIVPTYPNFWSGSFSDELYYTNNPVWVFLDLITNDRFGAGEWINLSDIDIYSLYRVSKYCDELVPDGKGGFEPRFTANLYLSKATDVYKVVKDMATIFSSLVYWMDGNLTTVLDSPGDPVYSFSKSNVIDGAFVYESTGQKTRINQVVVTWNNPEIGYAQSNVIVEDRNDIVASGKVISENAVAFGCTSEGQARRFGKWKLFTAQGQSEIVSFRTSFEGLFLKPGDIIEVQDSSRYGSMLSGRIAAVDTSGDNDVITVDRPLTLNSDYTYNLNILTTEPAAFYVGEDDLRLNSSGAVVASGGTEYSRGQRIVTNLYVYENSSYTSVEINTEARASNAFYLDGSTYRPIELSWKKDSYVESKSVTSSTNTSTSGNAEITISGSFDTAPAVSSVWMLEELNSGAKTTGSPDLYKILGIAQDEKNIYSISAVEHYNEKYAFVDDPDSIIDVPDDIYPEEEETIIAPSSVRVLQNSNATRPNEELIIEWDYPEVDSNGDPTSRFLDTFEILHTIPGRENVISVSNRTRSLAIENVPDGTYMFRVRAISASQKKSAWTSFKYTVDDPFDDKVNRIKGIQTEGLTSVFPFITNESSAGGNFRGIYDSTAGTYNSSTNKGGYSEGDIVSYQNTLYYLPEGGTVGSISTWTEYRGGLLKFSGTSNAILAPSRFRRNDFVNLGSTFSLDCNLLRRKNSTSLDTDSTELSYIGSTESAGRTAFAVLDNSESTVKIVDNKVDSDLGGVLYWYDLAHADDSSNTGVYKHWKNLSSGSGRNCAVADNSNKVTGTGTTFTELNNLDVVLFTENLFSGTSRTNVSFTASTKTINVGDSYGFLQDGDKIEIESSSGINQGRFTVASRTLTSITVEEALIDESVGATINIEKLQFIARVARVESDTVMYLDRLAPRAVYYDYHGTVFKQEYAPDYRKDVLLGKIRNDSSSGTGDFEFDNFLTFDPNLRGGRDVQLDINVAFLQYNSDEEQVLAPDNLTVTATAFGFDKPKFKITYGDPSTAPTDGDGNYTIFAAEETTHSSPPSGALTFYEKEIWDGTTAIPYGTGGNINIHVEVVEEEDPGDTQKQATDIISIPRVGDVATGEGSKSVFLELEAYDIVYEEGGTNPLYNGSSDNAITLTATASNGFTDPIFRFKVAGTALIKDATTYPGAEWFDPGASNIATIDFDVPANLGDSPNFTWGGKNGGSKTVVVEVAEKPENWTANVPTSGTNTNEPSENDIDAKDVDNIIAFRKGFGGVAASFTNDSHVIACDEDGNVIEESDGTTLRSGGVLRIYRGGVLLNYVSSNPGYGDWTITGTSTTEDSLITVGGITATEIDSSGVYEATIADHTFDGALGPSGFETTESITYNISVPQGYGEDALTLPVTQTFTLVKNGVVGASASLVYLYAPGPADTNNAPSSPSADFPKVKVDLSTGQISTSGDDDDDEPVFDGNEEGWYSSLTSAAAASTGNQIVYVVAATANGTGDFDFISYDEWTNSVPFTGADGFNSAVVEIFKQTNSSTMVDNNDEDDDIPLGTLTYTFSDGSLSTSNRNGWLTSQPSPSKTQPYIWKRTAAAISTEPTDTILKTEWSDAALVAQFVAADKIIEYYKNTTTNTAPSTLPDITYDFDDDSITETDAAGWSQEASGVNSTNLYEWKVDKRVIYPDSGSTVTISGNSWNGPILSAAYGEVGEAAYSVSATNINHTFVGQSDGLVDTNDFSCGFVVRKGSQAYTFANSGTEENTYFVSTSSATNCTPSVNSSTGVVTIAGTSDILDTSTIKTASFTIQVLDLGDSNAIMGEFKVSLSKIILTRGGGDFTKTSATNAAAWKGTLTNAAAVEAAAFVIANSGDGFIVPNDRVTMTDGTNAATRIYTGARTDTSSTVTTSSFSSVVTELFDGSVIVEGTLSADRLAANTTTTNQLNVGSILQVGPASGPAANGKVYSVGKTSYTDNTAGFYMDGSGKVNIGNSSNFMKFDGSTFSFGGAGGGTQAVKFVQVFKLNDSTLGFTTGNDATDQTYNSPTNGLESGWSTTIPTPSSGDSIYVAARTFTSDGQSPQTSSWDGPILYSHIGTDGADGADGAPGPAGADGTNGVDGVDGVDGAPGPAGADGVDGVDGAPGPAGPTGDTGPEGPEGPVGPEGPTGAIGPEGPVGPDGPAGPTGAIGPAGSAFYNVDVNTSTAASSVTPTNSAVLSTIGRYAVVGDIVVVTTNNTTTPSYGWRCTVAQSSSSNGSWTAAATFISGDLIVDGSIGASEIKANAIDANQLAISNANSGGTGIFMFSGTGGPKINIYQSGALRVKLGNLSTIGD